MCDTWFVETYFEANSYIINFYDIVIIGMTKSNYKLLFVSKYVENNKLLPISRAQRLLILIGQNHFCFFFF